MRKSKCTESQIVAILKEGEAGMAVAEVCPKRGISAATWYGWKSKYAGATVSDLTRMRELETENARLKRIYPELALDNAAMKDVIAKSTDAVGQTAGGSGLDSRAKARRFVARVRSFPPSADHARQATRSTPLGALIG